MLRTILAVIVRVLSNSFSNTFQKELVKTNSSCLVTCSTYFILSLLCVIPACFVNWSNFSLAFWLYVIIANLLCTLSTICIVKALRTGELSILSSINSYKCVVALLVAFLWLKEVPNTFGFCGLLFIVSGSWFVFDTTKEGFTIEFLKRQDVLLRILAMVLTGIEAVFLKKIITMSSFEISFILWCFGGFIFSLLILVCKKPKISIKIPTSTFFQFGILAICTGLMQLSTNYVFSRMNVGLALALFQLSTIVNLFIGYRIFKETNILKKFIGILIMLIGSVFILVLN